MAAKLLIPRSRRRGMQIIRNIKLILLSFHDRFLNFKENIGISDTNNKEVQIDNNIATTANTHSLICIIGNTE